MINKCEWYRFSQNKGCHAIDFMKEFYGLSFAEAVKELLGEEYFYFFDAAAPIVEKDSIEEARIKKLVKTINTFIK